MRNFVFICMVILLTACPALSQQAEEWRLAMDQGHDAERAGNYALAAAVYRDAVHIAEAMPERGHRLVSSLNFLAMTYDAMGRFTDSESAFQRALTAAEEDTGKRGPDYALLQTNLASLYVELGQTQRGESIVREALASYAAMERPDEVRVAMGHNLLAEIHMLTGKIQEAEGLLLESLQALRKHPEAWAETGVAMNNLGVIRAYQKQPDEAERLLRDSIAMTESHMGPNHPILVRTLNNMAAMYHQSGRREQAGEMLRRALSIAETTIGQDHPVYAAVLHNYADYLRAGGDKAGAKTLQARATKILRDSRRTNAIGSVIDISALRRK